MVRRGDLHVTNIRITSAALEAAAKHRRAGFLAEFQQRATRTATGWEIAPQTWGDLAIVFRIDPAARPGIGDRVHAVLHPVARAIDSAAGTSLSTCGSCDARRDALNRLGAGTPPA